MFTESCHEPYPPCFQACYVTLKGRTKRLNASWSLFSFTTPVCPSAATSEALIPARLGYFTIAEMCGNSQRPLSTRKAWLLATVPARQATPNFTPGCAEIEWRRSAHDACVGQWTLILAANPIAPFRCWHRYTMKIALTKAGPGVVLLFYKRYKS